MYDDIGPGQNDADEALDLVGQGVRLPEREFAIRVHVKINEGLMTDGAHPNAMARLNCR